MFTFLWACTFKHLSPHSWDQKQVKVTVYNEVGKRKMILFQTVLTLCWLWRTETRLESWKKTAQLCQRAFTATRIYVHGPANAFSSSWDAGKGRILHLYCSTKQPQPRPGVGTYHFYAFSPAWCMSKQDRQKAQCWSLYRWEYIQLPASCPSHVKAMYKEGGEEFTLERLSTAGYRSGSRWHTEEHLISLTKKAAEKTHYAPHP